MMKPLQDKRMWVGGGGGAAVLLVAVGWFMFIGPQLSSTRNLHSQAAQTRQQNAVLQLKVKTLQLKSAHLSRYTSSLRAALVGLPVDSGLPTFTRQLTAQAAADGVGLSSVSVGGITPVGPAAAPATGPSTTAAASAAGTTPATTPGTPGAPAALVSVQMTVLSEGTLTHQLAFLRDIRVDGPRRALVTSCQISPGIGAKKPSIDGASTFTTQLTIFSAPQTPAQIAQLKKLLSGNVGN